MKTKQIPIPNSSPNHQNIQSWITIQNFNLQLQITNFDPNNRSQQFNLAGPNLILNPIFNLNSETKTSVVFVMPVGCRPPEISALALKSVLKPQSLPALYQTKPPNAGIMLTSVTWLAAKSETVDTGSTFRAGSNTPRFANYLAFGMPALIGLRFPP